MALPFLPYIFGAYYLISIELQSFVIKQTGEKGCLLDDSCQLS